MLGSRRLSGDVRSRSPSYLRGHDEHPLGVGGIQDGARARRLKSCTNVVEFPRKWIINQHKTSPRIRKLNPFGSLRRRVEKIGVLDFASFGNNLQEFCNCISGTLQSVVDSVSQYSLHSFKLTIEVTAKSEVRLIGSAGTEVKGGLKLIFQRKQ